jgi:glycosyltransferase involved in cell wall biosynthesis
MDFMKISVIIPFFNEAKTIENVVKTASAHKWVDEAICVNDGSTDTSASIIKKLKGNITLLNYKKNRGKGYAMSKGVEKAKGEIILFLDADLIKLSDSHIEQMLEPFSRPQISGVLGIIFEKKPAKYKPWIFYRDYFITGIRAYRRKELLPHLSRMKEAKFGVEIFLNTLVNKEKLKVVPLLGVISPNKRWKRTLLKALFEHTKEGLEIAQELRKNFKYYQKSLIKGQL